ncbi:D-alanyl-D-alanine carboxypeptidase/D-alanyl-D-alanine endopeptidase [Actinokineospora pegani]|uniref:D-alanyl-D-alanine carboxypeptidase/D-alanyl-D-alanine endopeptidase n=1 Tax=Actinokineospora pegani TaxID=2654637 RepID=UPI0012EA8D58|nr:D-alanyl-D-alanine carboxypeptidase/D-alanyl-D-alanine-endopeptidase [Actinokineospora pegani]
MPEQDHTSGQPGDPTADTPAEQVKRPLADSQGTPDWPAQDTAAWPDEDDDSAAPQAGAVAAAPGSDESHVSPSEAEPDKPLTPSGESAAWPEVDEEAGPVAGESPGGTEAPDEPVVEAQWPADQEDSDEPAAEAGSGSADVADADPVEVESEDEPAAEPEADALAEPEAAEPEVVGQADPDQAEPEVAEPEVAEPQPDEVAAEASEPAEIDHAAEPEPEPEPEPELAEAARPEPEQAEPEAAEPEQNEPEQNEPEQNEPEPAVAAIVDQEDDPRTEPDAEPTEDAQAPAGAAQPRVPSFSFNWNVGAPVEVLDDEPEVVRAGDERVAGAYALVDDLDEDALDDSEEFVAEVPAAERTSLIPIADLPRAGQPPSESAESAESDESGAEATGLIRLPEQPPRDTSDAERTGLIRVPPELRVDSDTTALPRPATGQDRADSTAALPLPEAPQAPDRTAPRPPAPAWGRATPPEAPAERTQVTGLSPVRPAERTQVIRLPGPAEVTEPADEAPPAAEPARAKPQRIQPSTPEPEAPRKSRRGLVTAVALVAAVAIAAAVVFLVPGLAAQIGLTSGEPEASAPPPAAVEFTPTLKGPGGDAAPPTAAGVRSALAGPLGDPALGTLTGVVLDPATGEVLFSQGADTPLVPASTTKLLTSAAALLVLPPADQWVTRVVQGDKPGTVIIIGGGDPTLSSLEPGKNSVYPGAAHLTDLVNQVKTTGAVDTVLLDLDRYTGPLLADGWLPGDVGVGYISPMVPAMLDGGRADATKATSPRAQNPARDLAEEFAERIGAQVPDNAITQAPAGAKVLGEVRSAPFVELVDTSLQRSDNVLAEALGREVARAKGKDPSFAGAREAVIETLRENGFDTTSLELSDGSGLSTDNKVTVALLADVLEVAASPDGGDQRTAKLRPLLGALPVAGGSGTLATRYQQGGGQPGRGWVRAKTGTLSGVNTLAGVVLDEDGRVLVFALMSNGADGPGTRPALDTIAAALRGCGCR